MFQVKQTLPFPCLREYIPVMDGDVSDPVAMDHERSTRAAYELRQMLGNGCVDFGRILRILENRTANPL